jgi:dienelactone hydrolase
MTAPTLVLIGEADDWNPAERCREMAARSQPDGAKIVLSVYPGAYHAFDVVELKPAIRSLGHWLEFNQEAAEDAEGKTCTFLAANLGGTSGDEPQKRDKDCPPHK